MSKFKEFIRKVASKFSTPVKPLATEVFEEDKFKIDMQGNVKASKIVINKDGIHITSDNGIKLNMGAPNLPVSPEKIDTSFNADSTKKETVEFTDLNRLLTKTKSNRIKKKLKKRINTYGKNTITRN